QALNFAIPAEDAQELLARSKAVEVVQSFPRAGEKKVPAKTAGKVVVASATPTPPVSKLEQRYAIADVAKNQRYMAANTVMKVDFDRIEKLTESRDGLCQVEVYQEGRQIIYVEFEEEAAAYVEKLRINRRGAPSTIYGLLSETETPKQGRQLC